VWLVPFLRSSETNDEVGSRVAVILPTYCEAENIKSLISSIEDLPIDSTIIVVDDSSPDGTASLVKSLQKAYTNILLVTRPRKTGLGTAITDSFRFILSQPDPPDFIIAMDADYSHDPRDIPRLLKQAEEGYDVVIGSRYCPGGKVRGWNLRRLMISKAANKTTAKIVALPVHDLTSGFRCYSREYVEQVLPELHSETYEIQIETLRQARIHRATVAEVPITFTNRKMGKSKLTNNEILSYLMYILKTLPKAPR
jgi:dolichol-phosphate mannosyltransferase